MKTIVQIVEGRVRAGTVTEALCNRSHGGQAFFFGSVRDFNHGRKVKAVSYDCHKTIAKTEISKIITEARARWGEDLDAVVLHGTGRLNIGEFSVGIGMSSRHRGEAFEACRYVIEQLKVRVPIWKQEHYIDGDSDWLKGHLLCQQEGHANHSSHLSGRA